MSPLLDGLDRETMRMGVTSRGCDTHRLIFNAQGADEFADAMSARAKNPAKERKQIRRDIEKWMFYGMPIVVRENAARRWRFEPKGTQA